MSNVLAIEAFVGSEPRVSKTTAGATVCSFRAAVNHRRLDAQSGEWVSNGTSWYTVTSFGALADNVAFSISKGSAVVVIGDLKVRDWEANGKQGTSAEITASAIGPNLLFVGAKPAQQTLQAPTTARPMTPAPRTTADFIAAPTDLSEIAPSNLRTYTDEDVPF